MVLIKFVERELFRVASVDFQQFHIDFGDDAFFFRPQQKHIGVKSQQKLHIVIKFQIGTHFKLIFQG